MKSIRSALRAYLTTAGLSTPRADANLDAYRDEMLRDAIDAIESERLRDETGMPEDEAYNQAIDDAANAVRALLKTA